jgi:hypothetical protein
MEQQSPFQPPVSHTEQVSTSSPTRKNKKPVLVSLLLLLLISGVGAAAYYYGQQSGTSTTPAQQTTTNSENKQVTTPGVHFVKDVGYPFDLGAKKVFTTSLGLPDFIQGVSIDSTIQNMGINEYLTNKFNDEMGRWVVAYPDTTNTATDVSIGAIGKEWLAASQDYNDPLGAGDLRTPAKKQQYIATLKSETEACVKDSKKGFQFADKSLAVCYELLPGRDAFAPRLELRGYGVVNGVILVFLGYVEVTEGKKYSESEHNQLLTDGKQGKFPQLITERSAKIIEALSKSTISVANN